MEMKLQQNNRVKAEMLQLKEKNVKFNLLNLH